MESMGVSFGSACPILPHELKRRAKRRRVPRRYTFGTCMEICFLMVNIEQTLIVRQIYEL
jgi:hypothetical protein